jgi:serine-type D-Ala-D-Ala carboxypeptidase/endopeptidase (penicillin-binding protein 4)
MRHIVLFLFLFIHATISLAQISEETLITSIENFSKDPVLKHASWSICVREANTKRIIAEKNSETMLVPASVIKFVTTATALDILGEDFKFKTTLAYSGNIDSLGILHGNIYIIGGGDPTFGTWRFGNAYTTSTIYEKFYQAIVSIGIKAIHGRIISDASIFDNHLAPVRWQWEDIGNYYGAGCSGLNNHENMYTVCFKSGSKIGDNSTVVETEPFIPNMEYINEVTTAKYGSGDQVYIYGAPFNNTRILTGTIPLGESKFKIKGSIPDPAYYTSSSFHIFLSNKGMKISDLPSTKRILEIEKNEITDTRINLTSHSSPTLLKIVEQTNLHSNNVYAECIFKYIAYHKKGFGSIDNGITAITNYWISKGVNTNAFRISDGCGLSRYNATSTAVLSDILAVYSTNAHFEAFYESLPNAGKSGTLARMFKGTVAEGNLHAKSGTMSKVKAYAGYVYSRSGKLISFAFIINNYEGSSSKIRNKMEAIMIKIAQLQ